MHLYDELLTQPEFTAKPLVLLDLGASGHLHGKWKALAPYAHCIAFDADDREFGFAEKEGSGFKRLLVYHCIATDQDAPEMDFYLTASPFCSSALKPATAELAVWEFAEKFAVERTVRVKARHLRAVVQEAGYNHVDWFKSDTQGTDLRLFRAMGDDITRTVLAAELEPGIIDAYEEEDTLAEVLLHMKQSGFWLAAAVVKGSRRIAPATITALAGNGLARKLLSFSLRSSPGWIEMLYLRQPATGSWGRREYYVSYLAAMLSRQYGYAYELAAAAGRAFPSALFTRMAAEAKKQLLFNALRLQFLPAVAEKIKKLLQWD